VTLVPLFTEVSLASDQHRYRGTIDYVGFVNGQLSIVDWKTSDRVYPEMLLQLAAYGNLWDENHPDELLTGGFHLLCVSKETASFSHHHFDALPGAMEAFLHLLALHELHLKDSNEVDRFADNIHRFSMFTSFEKFML
jgi:hypothetical protein